MTLDEAKESLAGMGITPPDFIIQGWLDVFAGAQPCLDAHYTPNTILTMLYYLVGLYGLSTGVRYVSSESAPSGASRSYKYGEPKQLWKANLNALRLLDKHGCLTDLIPANPNGGSAFLGVGKGGCYERHR